MSLNQSLFDATVELHFDIERVSIYARAEVVALLKKMEQELIAKVSQGVTDWSKARISKQLSEAEAVIRQYYADAAGLTQDITTDVAQVSATATAQALSVAVGGQVAIGVLPTATMLEAIASDAIIQGATQKAWWSRQSGDTAFKFQSAVRQGLVSAETTQQIIRRVIDVTDLSRRNAATLVQTSAQTVANNARLQTFSDNSDIVASMEWTAALDRRTCPTCGALDGKRWKLDGTPIKGSMPFQKPTNHFRCRCSLVPITKTWRELGIKMDEMPESTRASMDGQVTDTSFESWLERKTKSDPSFADATLGKGRAEMWKKGVITFDQMFDGLRPLTVKQLKEKYS
jgi:SPP1 gp7 family putative phage head morphogenesis protein